MAEPEAKMLAIIHAAIEAANTTVMATVEGME